MKTGLVWKKRTVAIDLILICIALSGVAYASYWVYSNVITVTPNTYSLTLSIDNTSPNQYDNITLSAILNKNGSPAADGLTIHFFKDNIDIGTALTLEGTALFQYNYTDTVAHQFKAGYEVP